MNKHIASMITHAANHGRVSQICRPGQIVSIDFFVVPTIRLRVLFVFLVLELRRREVLHCNVTEHPTSAWVAQQRHCQLGQRTETLVR
jgi:hypothetical protein